MDHGMHAEISRGRRAFTYLSGRREVEDKAYHGRTTAGGGAYREGSRAPNDLRVIFKSPIMLNDAGHDIDLSDRIQDDRAHEMPRITIKRKHLVAQNVQSFV